MTRASYITVNRQWFNRPPRPCQALNGWPCAACSKLSQLEAKACETPGSLQHLLQQHRQACTEVNRLHNPIILQAPPEIASMIFTHCFPPATVPPDSAAVLPPDFRKHVAARLVLGAVCHEWRQIAWSIPQLWTEIAVNLDLFRTWQLDFFQAWIGRSGELPLSISVSLQADLSPGPPTDMVNVLKRVAHRWRIIHLGNITPHNFKISLPKSILQAISFVGHRQGRKPDRSTVKHSDALLTPSHVVLSWISWRALSADWSMVTSLCVMGRCIEEYFEVLRKTVNLQNLTLDFSKSHDKARPPADPAIALSKLEHLHINEYSIDVLEKFIEVFILPHLKKLTVTEFMAPFPAESLLALIRRSGCQLKELAITGTYFGHYGIVSLLENLPTLECLSLAPDRDRDNLPDELFVRLAETTRQTGIEEAPFLPRLRSLVYDATERYYRRSTRNRFPWKTFFEILGPDVDSNDLPRRPLRNVELHFALESSQHFLTTIDKEWYPALQALLDSDLHLTMEDPGTREFSLSRAFRNPEDLLPKMRELLQKE